MPPLIPLVPKNFGSHRTPKAFQLNPPSPPPSPEVDTSAVDAGLDRLIINAAGQFVGKNLVKVQKIANLKISDLIPVETPQ